MRVSLGCDGVGETDSPTLEGGFTGFSRHAFARGVAPVAFATGVAGADADPDFFAARETGEVEVAVFGVFEVQAVRGDNDRALKGVSADTGANDCGTGLDDMTGADSRTRGDLTGFNDVTEIGLEDVTRIPPPTTSPCSVVR
jgi:hypothetical protein